jgi:probable O-glycosylation ligase (exosortase A-associated)
VIRASLFACMMSVALAAAFKSPLGALNAYIWFALFRPQEWVWANVSQFRFSLILGVILIVRSVIDSKLPNLSHRNTIAIFGVLLTALVAQQGAAAPEIGWRWLDFLARLTLVTLLLVSIIDTPRRLLFTVMTVATSFGYHCTKAGIASAIGGGLQFYAGLSGAFLDNNAYAVGAVMVLPMLWTAGRNIPEHWRFRRLLTYGYYLTVPFSILAVISTFSRSGFLALATALMVFSALNWRKAPALLAALVVVVLLAPFMPLPAGYFDRLQTIQTYQEVGDGSALGRLHFWRVALVMVQEHPLGVGLFNYEANYDAYDFLHGMFGMRRSVHNSHLQILTETGIVGFGLWVWLFIGSLGTCFRIRRRYAGARDLTADQRIVATAADAFIISMISFLVGGLFISMGLNDLTWLTFGMVAALDRITKNMPAADSSPEPALMPANAWAMSYPNVGRRAG